MLSWEKPNRAKSPATARAGPVEEPERQEQERRHPHYSYDEAHNGSPEELQAEVGDGEAERDKTEQRESVYTKQPPVLSPRTCVVGCFAQNWPRVINRYASRLIGTRPFRKI